MAMDDQKTGNRQNLTEAHRSLEFVVVAGSAANV